MNIICLSNYLLSIIEIVGLVYKKESRIVTEVMQPELKSHADPTFNHKAPLVSSLFEKIINVQNLIPEAFETSEDEELVVGPKQEMLLSPHKLIFKSPTKKGKMGENELVSIQRSEGKKNNRGAPRLLNCPCKCPFLKVNKMRKIHSEPLNLNHSRECKENEYIESPISEEVYEERLGDYNFGGPRVLFNADSLGLQLSEIAELSSNLENQLKLSGNIVECDCAN